MTFGGAIESVFRQYATFRGRASRSEYWYFYLFTVLLNLATGFVDTLIGNQALSTITSLALLIPTLAVTVRRLHDSDLSGWWILAPVGLALAGVAALFVGVIAALGGLDSEEMSAGADLAIVACVALFLAAAGTSIYLMVRRSTPGPNRFGQNPNGPGGQYGGYRAAGGYPQANSYGTPNGGVPQYGGEYGGQGEAQYGPQYGVGYPENPNQQR